MQKHKKFLHKKNENKTHKEERVKKVERKAEENQCATSVNIKVDHQSRRLGATRGGATKTQKGRQSPAEEQAPRSQQQPPRQKLAGEKMREQEWKRQKKN